ncbi:MAG: hypothetical protein ABIH46_10445 [Chloroflexota bacterium]
MAHTYAYTYIGAIETEQPSVKKHILKGHITLSTDGGDAYSRTTRLVFTFSHISNIIDVLALYFDVVANTGMVPVYSAISGNTLTVGVLESGPDTAGPLREKAEEAWEQEYSVYAIVAGI